VEESIHYTHTEADLAEWKSILPRGQPFVRVGPDGRLFAVSMYHQVRFLMASGWSATPSGHVTNRSSLRQIICLQRVQKGLHETDLDDHEREEVSKCFNYLRCDLVSTSDRGKLIH
jgi:hypothetical protein